MAVHPAGILFGRATWRGVALLAAVLAVSSGAWGQKKKKDQPVNTTPMPKMPMSVPEQIDNNIGEMLGAFQVGNVEEMHKYYADNATFVRGTYEPPLVGWQNYVAQYQQQRAAFGGFQIIRRNTSVFVLGDTAWATYLWEFDAMYQNRPYSARGQTTLVFNKVGENWLIVHNHTSEICGATSVQSSQPQTQPPAQNPSAPSPPAAQPKP
ncbi:MAG TPA: nuclear transport factor 2 family protein [Candidatus Limnocylindrales bacterium]|nr:nuclear transport factor 2 family protein [Candidatus Limnocylindrales bacterium]